MEKEPYLFLFIILILRAYYRTGHKGNAQYVRVTKYMNEEMNE